MRAKHLLWVKINPDYEILFRLMDNLHPEARGRYSVVKHDSEGNPGEAGTISGEIATEIQGAIPVPHNTLTSVEEYPIFFCGGSGNPLSGE